MTSYSICVNNENENAKYVNENEEGPSGNHAGSGADM